MEGTPERTKNTKETGLSAFPIVGIGASAGGLKAFTALLAHLPATTGMAYVLVQHLEPTHESILDSLLARITPMPVSEATDGMLVEADHVYVIAPNTDMSLTQGRLTLLPRTQETGRHLPIDTFLCSLADAQQQYAIGVILSGTASDGTRGLQAIKERGGSTFAQDEASAAYHEMPQSAIAAGCVDWVGSPEAIAAELIKLSSHPALRPASNAETSTESADHEREFQQTLQLLSQHANLDFTDYKPMTIRRRILRRMALQQVKSFPDYLLFLQNSRAEVDTLLREVLITVTTFFRTSATLQALVQDVFPRLVKAKTPHDPIRIWVPGCSSGEEVYSLAICLLEFLEERSLTLPIQIFGTDINSTAIEQARAGRYPARAVRAVSAARLQRFFTLNVNGAYQVNASVRDLCVFTQHNLLSDPPFSRIDVISCQNLLIYLEPRTQQKVMRILHYALLPEGVLVLGRSETIGTGTDLFAPTGKKHKLYLKKITAAHTPLLSHLNRRKSLTSSARDKEHAMHQAEESRNVDLQQETNRLLLERYAPASVVIDSDMEILYVQGHTSLYLESAPGKASLNLLKMARASLRLELRTAIHKARKSGRAVKKENLQFTSHDRLREVTIEVLPLKAFSMEHYFLILFEETLVPDSAPAPANAQQVQSARRGVKDRRIAHLERELEATREDMRSIIEELEATNEELQSATEELLSSNEEYQSLNEELETSKEEIQASNEELIGMNQQLQQRNAELQEAWEYAEAIVETIREPLLVLDASMAVLTANRAFYQFFQVSPEETRQHSLFDLEDDQWNIAPLRTLLEGLLPTGGTFTDYEVEGTFPSIGRKTMLLNARRIVGDTRRMPRILLAMEDISEEKQAQRLIQEQTEHLRFITEAAPQMLWTAQADGSMDYLNQLWLTYTGRTLEELKDIYNRQEMFHPDDWEATHHTWQESLAAGTDGEIEARLRRADGTYRWHLMRWLPQCDSAGQIIRWVGTTTDIDDQKRVLEQREEFLGIASHELKTPVTSLKSYTQVLYARFIKAGDEPSAALLAKMEAQLNKLITLISELLDVTKIDAGQLPWHEEWFDVDTLVRDSVEELARTTDRHHIRIEGGISRQVLGDQERIGQVLTNLLSNAIKYSPQADTILVKLATDEETVTIGVQDFGIGLAPEKQGHVFERFFRVSDPEYATFPGLGLGLYISAQIVKRQGGQIWMESSTGAGSTFFFSLPCASQHTSERVRKGGQHVAKNPRRR
ncbi:MAG: ATP-binding protein [Chloroflexota bacterium]|nr:ATP-binding protein [Chloroflexota bacterium]